MKLNREYLETLVCDRFRNEEHYRLGHIHIIAAAPGTDIIGIHTPEMKMVARKVISDDSRTFPQLRPVEGPRGRHPVDVSFPRF